MPPPTPLILTTHPGRESRQRQGRREAAPCAPNEQCVAVVAATVGERCSIRRGHVRGTTLAAGFEMTAFPQVRGGAGWTGRSLIMLRSMVRFHLAPPTKQAKIPGQELLHPDVDTGR